MQLRYSGCMMQPKGVCGGGHRTGLVPLMCPYANVLLLLKRDRVPCGGSRGAKRRREAEPQRPRPAGPQRSIRGCSARRALKHHVMVQGVSING